MTVRKVAEVKRKMPLADTYEFDPGKCYLTVVGINQVNEKDIRALIRSFSDDGVTVTVLVTPDPPPDIRIFDMFTMKETP